ncbi:MAG: UDPGP type 1 family protein [Planctomycetaceae bacterium]|nr:UDPGP type 1 family protein [Planctomycetaceae bacterium]
MTSKKTLLEKLAPWHQEHLLTQWDALSDTQRRQLSEQVDSIDFAQLAELYKNRDHLADIASLASQAKEPPSFLLGGEQNRIPKADAVRAGQEALRQGKVAVLVVAGGQGTRLGFDHPKGMFPIGPVADTTLFQIHVEKIIARGRQYGRSTQNGQKSSKMDMEALQRRAVARGRRLPSIPTAVSIPFCVMTSPATHEETVEFFEQNHRFGLAESDLLIFCQGTMPAVSLADGKVLLAAPGRIALSPDGHGGMLAAIEKNGILAQLADRDIEMLFYFQVDNALVDIANEEFLGAHILSGSELTSQVVRKKSPQERVGNIVSDGERLHIIEYSDLPDDIAAKRKPDGSLEIWAGSIAVHVMSMNFLKRQAAGHASLPFHVAKKKVPYLDEQGQAVNPPEPNAIKFERFIFDLLPAAQNAVVVEVDPRRHFAPLKNASGSPTDSPEIIRKQLSDFYTEWLVLAGATVAQDALIEISPLFANSAETLAAQIPPGTVITKNQYFAPR